MTLSVIKSNFTGKDEVISTETINGLLEYRLYQRDQVIKSLSSLDEDAERCRRSGSDWLTPEKKAIRKAELEEEYTRLSKQIAEMSLNLSGKNEMSSQKYSNTGSLIPTRKQEIVENSSNLISHGVDLANTFSKEEVFLNVGHAGIVNSIAFSYNGRYAISGSDDCTLIMWDVYTGRVVRSYSDHTGSIERVVFSPDGTYVLSAGADHKVKLWDIISAKVIKTFTGHEGYVSSIAFSHAGNLILSGSHDNTLRLWDVNTGRALRTFIGHSREIQCIAFSPDDRFVLSGDFHGTIKLWDIKKETSIKEWVDESEAISTLAFSVDGRFFLSGGGVLGRSDYNLTIWDIVQEKPRKILSSQPCAIMSIHCLLDGRHVLSGNEGGQVTLWDMFSGIETKTFYVGLSRAVAFSHDGKFVLTPIDYASGLELYDISSGGKIRTFSAPIQSRAVAISNDYQHCLSGGDDGLKLWDLQSGKKIRELCGDPDYYVRSIKFLPDKRFAVSANFSGVRLWDVANWKCLRMFEDLSDVCYGGNDAPSFEMSELSPNGKYLIGLHGNDLSIWDVLTGAKIETIERPGSHNPLVFAMSHDGQYVIRGDANAFYIWNIYSGVVKENIISYDIYGGIDTLAFSQDDRFILLGCSTGTIIIWDFVNGKEDRTLTGHSASISSITFANKFQFLSSSYDGNIKLWDVCTGELVRTFKGHQNKVWSLSTNGIIVLSGGDDGLKAWDLSTGQLLASLIDINDGEWIVVTPEGYYNSSNSGEKYINVRVGDKAYGIDNYRQKYYRPDLVKMTLAKPYT